MGTVNNLLLLLRPCAFFSMFLVTFFSPNLRGRAKKKQNAQRKKKHWLSVPDYLTDKHTKLIVLSAVILLFIFHETTIELNSFQSRRPRNAGFSWYLTSLRGQRTCSNLQPKLRFINIANAFVLPRSLVRWEARPRFRFQTKHILMFLSKQDLITISRVYIR